MPRWHLKSWSSVKLRVKLSVIAFVPFVLTSACIAAALAVLSDAQAEERTQQRARQVISDCGKVRDSTLVCGTILSLFTHTHDPQLLDEFQKNLAAGGNGVQRLKSDLKDELVQPTQILDELNTVTHKLNATLEGAVPVLSKDDGGLSLLKMVEAQELLVPLVSRQRRLLDDLETYAEKLKTPSSPKYFWSDFMRENLSSVVGLSVLLSVAAGLLLSRSIVDRLKVLTDKAARLSRLQPPASVSAGNDEIAELDGMFNAMAYRLLEAVKRERSAIACAADLILCVGADGIVQSVNTGAPQNYGWQSSDLIGTSVLKLAAIADHAVIINALKSSTSSQFEGCLLHADGKESSCLWSFSWSPGQQAAIAIVHDVSERKTAELMLAESETRVRLVLERMPTGLILLSHAGLIRFLNSTAVNILGRSRDELSDVQFLDLLTGAQYESPQSFIELLTQRSQAYVATLSLCAVKDRRVQLHLSRFGKHAGEELFLLILLDCTEDAQFEELKQRLVAMVAHDIGSPLVTVQSTLEMANSAMLGTLPPDLQAIITKAEQESTDIREMFNNVVRFHRLASGLSNMDASRLSLKELTNEALDVVEERLDEKNIVIDNQVPIEIAAMGDATQLAVLGATLLQVTVEACAEDTTMRINASKEANHVLWRLTTGKDLVIGRQLELFLTESQPFKFSEAAEASSLDLILWKLLLYQCGAKVSLVTSEEEYEIQLKLPSLQTVATTAFVA